MKIGIIGYGHYGKLLHALIRRFVLTADVVIHSAAAAVDGRVFVDLDAMHDCDAIIFAVPMDSFEDVVSRAHSIPDLRDDTVFVNVCSDQAKSSEALARLAGDHPRLSFHTPWGPEAYRMVNEIVSALPATVVTDVSMDPRAFEAIEACAHQYGFKTTRMAAIEHDKTLAGRQMYVTHLIAQTLQLMGLLDGNLESAPLSFQDLARSASLVRNDAGLFYDLWSRVPECGATFEKFVAAVHELERRKDEHVNGNGA